MPRGWDSFDGGVRACPPSRWVPMPFPLCSSIAKPARADIRPSRQSGIAALALVAVLLLASLAWLAADMVRTRAQASADAPAERDHALRQAREAIAFFAGAYSRLPCQAGQAGGTEDCMAEGARWLPSASLGLAGGKDTADKAGAQAVPVRYLLYRARMARVAANAGAGLDDPALPAATDAGASPGASNAAAPNGLDFCAALQSPGLDGADGQHAAGAQADDVPAAAAPAGIAAVYALAAHGADATGSVRPAELYGIFECAVSLASARGLSQAADLVRDSADMQASNLKKAANLANVMRMVIAHRALEVDLALFDLGAALYMLIANQINLQAAIASLLAGIPPPPNAIPDALAGIAKAMSALKLNAIDIPRSIVSLALDSTTLQRYQEVSARALDTPTWQAAGDIAAQARRAGLGTERARGMAPPPPDFRLAAGAPG